MTLNRFFAVAAIPVLMGSFAFAMPDQADAANPSRRMAQNSTQPKQQGQGQQGQQRQRRAHPPIDFAAAAAKLNISEADLKAALGVSGDSSTTNGQKRRLDIRGAAAKLGITEQQLVQALGLPPRPPRPDFAAAASKLGVTEAQLKAALGVPANPPSENNGQRPPRPDFKAAAAKLGVTEQQLIDALGIPPRPPGGDRPANQSGGAQPPNQ